MDFPVREKYSVCPAGDTGHLTYPTESFDVADGTFWGAVRHLVDSCAMIAPVALEHSKLSQGRLAAASGDGADSRLRGREIKAIPRARVHGMSLALLLTGPPVDQPIGQRIRTMTTRKTMRA
jgi:hypothetical protein